MTRLRREQLHVRLLEGARADGPIIPRRYTLTHSDSTGELFLTIGPEHDRQQISGWYTRFMRDEVLAEWVETPDGPALHVHCHVSGGLVLGTAGWRDAIFQRELPLVLEAFLYGDRRLFDSHPELDRAPIRIYFHASKTRYNRVESWGTPADYALADV